MAAAYTISVSKGEHTEEHSRRSYTPKSADRSLWDERNIIYDCGDDREHFNKFFRSSIEEFNQRQVAARHPERQKDFDYFGALLDGREGYGKGKQQEKPVYHDVIQIGNRETNGVTDHDFDVEHWRQLKKEGKLDEASAYVAEHKNNSQDAKDFRKILEDLAHEILENKDHKYDGILTHGLVIHSDEPNGTVHLDWRYSFYTDEGARTRKNGKRNGMAVRVSQTKCLARLGFRTTKSHTALEQFRDSIKDRIEEKMNAMGYQRDIKGEHRKHLPNEVFEMEQEAKKAGEKKKQLELKVNELEDSLSVLDGRKDSLSDEVSSLEDELLSAKQTIKTAGDRERGLKENEESMAAASRALEAEFYNFQNMLFQILYRQQERNGKKKEKKNFKSLKELEDAVMRELEESVSRAETQRKSALNDRKNALDEKKSIEDEIKKMESDLTVLSETYEEYKTLRENYDPKEDMEAIKSERDRLEKSQTELEKFLSYLDTRTNKNGKSLGSIARRWYSEYKNPADEKDKGRTPEESEKEARKHEKNLYSLDPVVKAYLNVPKKADEARERQKNEKMEDKVIRRKEQTNARRRAISETIEENMRKQREMNKKIGDYGDYGE